jgi:predicted ATPase/DNA-binding CsgD family transcriptional regulator
VSSLPNPATPLLGREAEVATVRALLDAGDTRLVTLTGPGGIGKTRLAIAVAASMEADFAHGACFVGLASTRDPALVPAVVARALGLQESGDRPAAALVVSALRDRHLLLVLDNLEHLVAGSAAWTSELLDRCPRLSVLTTSRVALRIAGEHRFQVQPLALPDDPAMDVFESLSASAAVELFVQRARAVRPDFALTAGNAGTVWEICLALDGLPLAIELAAVWLRVLSPDTLLARLADRLAILAGDQRDAAPRHRTMRDTIAWSHDLLSPEQQALFRRLSVFTGGFTLEAAEAVGGASRGAPVLDLVTDLVDQSLLQLQTPETGGNRLRMLEIVREFGLERLAAEGEAVAARDAHAAWYLEQARRFEVGWDGPGQVDWLNRVEADHGNVRAALGWLVDRERIEDAQDMAGSLMMAFTIRGHYAEARRLYEDLVGDRRGGEATVARAKALLGLSVIAVHQGDAERARAALEEAIGIFRALGDQVHLSVSLECLGMVLGFLGRFDESEATTATQLDLSREIGYQLGIQGGLNNLGLDAMRRGDLAEARRLMRQSVEIARENGYTWGLALGLGNLGWFELVTGRDEVAEPLILEATELLRALDSKRDLPISLADLAEIARRRGDVDIARGRLNEALAIAEDTGNWIAMAAVLRGSADLQRSTGDLVEAAAFARRAFETWIHGGNMVGSAGCLDTIADIAVAAGDMAAAARLVGAADGVRERAGQERAGSFPGEHEQRLEAIRGALDEGAFRAAWDTGRALSMDETIAMALAWEPPARAVPEAGAPPAAPESVSGLSPRELEVLRLMAQGTTNQDIADALFLSRRTVTSHVSSILGKLDVPSRTAAVAWALRSGLA